MSAQTIVRGDMNKDGSITISDVTALVNVATGNSSPEVIKAYEVDNTSVIGTWYASNGTALVLLSNGTTNYQGEATYEFFPFLRHLLIFNASGNIVKTMTFREVTPQYLLEENLINGELTYYTNSNYIVTGITLDQSTLNLNAGSSAQLTATITPFTAQSTSLVWTSSDESIAAVDTSGKVTGVKAGTVTVTGTKTGSESKVYAVPDEIDAEIATIKLRSMGVEIDTLTEAQVKYVTGWEEGT